MNSKQMLDIIIQFYKNNIFLRKSTKLPLFLDIYRTKFIMCLAGSLYSQVAFLNIMKPQPLSLFPIYKFNRNAYIEMDKKMYNALVDKLEHDLAEILFQDIYIETNKLLDKCISHKTYNCNLIREVQEFVNETVKLNKESLTNGIYIVDENDPTIGRLYW